MTGSAVGIGWILDLDDLGFELAVFRKRFQIPVQAAILGISGHNPCAIQCRHAGVVETASPDKFFAGIQIWIFKVAEETVHFHRASIPVP